MDKRKECNEEKKGITISQYNSKQLICAGIAVLSVMASFFLIPYHEIWRDEAQAWLIARDTPLSELFQVLKHEGHPFLWFLILMPFAKAGIPVICMNYISWLFTAVAVFIIAFKAPFKLLTKFLILLSPMYVYWLPVVSRSYAPLNCFIVLLAMVYSKRKEHTIVYGLILFCLINLHLISAGIVGAVLLIDVFNFIMEFRKKGKVELNPYTGTMIGIIGCLLMVIQLWGSPDTGDWNISVINNPELIKYRLLSEIMNMVFPFSSQYGLLILFTVLLFVFILTVIICLGLEKQWDILMIFCMETLFLWYILLFIMPSGQKQHLLFSTIIFVLWISSEKKMESYENLIVVSARHAINIMISIIFAAMIITGYPNTVIYEIREPYTMGKETAEYLNRTCNSDDIIIFMDNAYEPSVTAYLDHSLLCWDMTENRISSFPLWSRDRIEVNSLLYKVYSKVSERNADIGIKGYTGRSMTDILQSYIDQTFSYGSEVYFVMTSDVAKLYDLEESEPDYTKLASFSNECKYSRESFCVYFFVSKGDN